MVILYVEDSLAFRDEVVQRHLSAHRVVTAATVREARAIYQRGMFDLVLLDFELPDGTGAEFAQAIRNAGDNVPIIANSSSDAYNHRLIELGATHALPKRRQSELPYLLMEIQMHE